MKLKKTSIITSLMCFVSFFCLYSCNADDDTEKVNNGISASTNSALEAFSLRHESLWIEARYASTTRSKSTSTSELDDQIIEQIDENIQEFCKKNDIFADLTPSQKADLIMSPDSAEMIRLDPDVYLEYTKKHKSEAFNDILYQILKKKRTDFDSNDIINNTGLYLNEKVHLLLILPALHSMTDVGITRAATSSKSSSKESAAKKQACLEEYDDAKLWCMLKYLGSTALSLLGVESFWPTVVGYVWAYRDYFACEDDALYHYRMCLNN